MRSQRPCGETVDPRVIEHMPRTAQDCCTIESRLFLSHACTLSSITLSLIRCHFSLPLVARLPRSSSRQASTPPAWAWSCRFFPHFYTRHGSPLKRFYCPSEFCSTLTRYCRSSI